MFEEPTYRARRLPIYLMMDVSAGMAGDKIEALQQGMQVIFEQLANDPRSAETVYLSIITFGNTVSKSDLTPLYQFVPPVLAPDQLRQAAKRSPFTGLFGLRQSAGRGDAPQCCLGKALGVLTNSIKNELVPNGPGKRGDYRPLVFLLIGNRPTDGWRKEITFLQALYGTLKPTVTVFITGSDIDSDELTTLTANILRLSDVTAVTIGSVFRWISASITRFSDPVPNDRELSPPPGPIIWS